MTLPASLVLRTTLVVLRSALPATIAALLAPTPTALAIPSGSSSSSPGLSIHPPSIRLADPTDRQQVAVTATFADGSTRDVTAEARVELRSEGVARVSSSGVVEPGTGGIDRLIARFGEASAEVPVEVVSSTPPRAISYRQDVVAVLSKAGCNMGPCHGNLTGKGGFKLSLRGDDPGLDLLRMTRDAFGRRVNTADPDSSLLLLKPIGLVPHEGGRRFGPDDPEAEILRSWIAGGGRDDLGTVPELVSLSIFPPERVNASPSLAQQLVVTATFADGSTRDVTRLAAFDVDDPTEVEVSPSGLVRREAPGQSVVSARYLGQQAVSRLAFLPDRPGFVWDGPEPLTPFDRAVFDQLQTLTIHASPPAPDHVFLRRAYLDCIGVLPTPDEARSFLEDTDPDKRARLVDRLLGRPEFADFWALKWADLLRNEEKTMGPKGVWAFHRWLRDRIAADVPLTELAEQLLTGSGSSWANPPASFYRTNRDPETCAESFGQIFLGVRLQCARCHNHPFDVWTQDDYYGLAAAFANIDRKEVNNSRRDRLNSHEINGDVIIHLDGRPRMRQPVSGERLAPTAPGGVPLAVGPDLDARAALARWLTESDRQFARNMANRAWFHLMGRGVVEPVDDFRATNPPSNPELLDALTATFEAGGNRLKPLVRAIMTSRVYALDSSPRPTNRDDEANFARARVKLLPAEVLLDAIGSALGRPADLDGVPPGTRAVALAGANTGPEFLDAFGKPDRLLTCECERSESTTLGQAFQLINGDVVRAILEAPDNRIGRLLASGTPDDAILDELYLAALCRLPSPEERSGALAHLSAHDDPRLAWEDIAWAIVNSKEFLLRR
ncbi:DUF1549 domain-containing protein [Tautonia sociabilis]|uniref:DUF1549 domain-containing protein n=1 Tax=Tautonia sociabilis TaxID=2080755 RepID=A0A432MMG7_9BACT|nr:DUF1549 domain-containing protein [Tautonia sociabilis]RUL88387.1 DUF1549 domain-containing protein [Tautonia sociabilis]